MAGLNANEPKPKVARDAKAEKANRTTQKKATKVPPTSTPDPQKQERLTVKPEFWDPLLDSIPPWIDEIAAILLVVFGVVSFLSLLNVSSDATIAAAWSNALTGLFGQGALIVCGGIFLLGIIIWLPKLGIVIRFPTQRILAIEFAFFSILALLHLNSGESELRRAAGLGQGGGQVGWAFSTAVSSIVGIQVAAIIFGVILVLSIAVVLGLNRRQLGNWLKRSSQKLHAYGEELRAPYQKARQEAKSRLDDAHSTPVKLMDTDAPQLLMPTAAQTQRIKHYSLMRIKVNLANIPPSLRQELRNASQANTATEPQEASAPTPTVSAESLPIFQRKENNFNAIGTIKGKPGKASGPLLVERPDGRMKRYFTVSNLKEPRSNIKRDANLPSIDLLRNTELNLPNEQEINQNVVLIENTLLEFDIDVDVVDVKVGPTVTQYAVQPYVDNKDIPNPNAESPTFSRTRVSKIASLANDLALALSARRLRLETPVPGHSYIGIEVPNKNPSVVALRSVYESKAYAEIAAKKKAPLLVPLGRDVAGAPVAIDLVTMPHLLIAGTTGSGKSVCIAAIAASLILDNTPDMVKMVMLDPKMVELSRFNGIPHLIGNVETDQERIIEVLHWCTREMDRRYRLLEENAARNIDIYNSRLGRRKKDDQLPYIVVFVDEIGDLMMSKPDETEKTVTRLAQMARAVGIHLIVATQRPSVDVITGLIKANFPSRISFAVASSTDSRVILDAVGAETLMGKGDMLYMPADGMAPQRLQGCFISDDEVRALTKHWKDWTAQQIADGKIDPKKNSPWERGLTRREFLAETDPMLEQAIELVIAEQDASASLIQRRLGLGYPRAARIMDLLVELAIVGEVKDGGRSREVLIKPGKDPFKDLIDERMNKANTPPEN